MPLIFDEIETSIGPERSADGGSRASGGGGGEAHDASSDPAMLADALREQMKIVKERQARLTAD
jgi:hypothetical protein